MIHTVVTRYFSLVTQELENGPTEMVKISLHVLRGVDVHQYIAFRCFKHHAPSACPMSSYVGSPGLLVVIVGPGCS